MSKQLSNTTDVAKNQQPSFPLNTNIINFTEEIINEHKSVEGKNIEKTCRDNEKLGMMTVAEKLSEMLVDKAMKPNEAHSILPQPTSITTVKRPPTYNHDDPPCDMEGNDISRDLTEVRASNVPKAIPTINSTSQDSKSQPGKMSYILSGKVPQLSIAPLHASPMPRPEAFDATKTRAVDFRSDSPDLAAMSSAPRFHFSQKVQPKPKNAPPASTNYNNVAQYGKPIPPYLPSVLQNRHHAAAAAAAVSVAAHNDAKAMLHSEKPSATFMRDQIPVNVAGTNFVLQGTESKPELVSQRNRPISLQFDSRRNSGGRPHAPSYSVGQHHAATSAAEQHLQWRVNTNPTTKQSDSKHAKAFPEIIEIDDDAEQKVQLINHFTAAIERQLAGSEASADQETKKRTHEYPGWKDQVSNDRKRGFPEPIDMDSQKGAVTKRQALPNFDVRNPTKYSSRAVATNWSGNTNGTASASRTNHTPIQQTQNTSMRHVNVNDAMNIALDAAISSDSTQYTKAMSSSGSRVDSPMTYLVRQLLGQVEILGDEPAVVLAPPLVRDASNKIRLVINKLIEMIVVKSNKDSEAKIREAESRVDALQKSNFASGREKAVDDAYYQKNFLALRAFAEEKCQQLSDRDKQIEYLRMKLESQETAMEDSTIRRSKSSHSNLTYEEKTNATMRQLISRLDEGMTTIQRQQKEIQVLKAIVDKDKNALQSKRDMIPFLKQTFGLCDGTMTEQNNDAAQNQEIVLLKTELEDLQATLLAERRQHEITLKAYMRAAVHALKIQSGDTE
jgi:hypothetical protein